MPQETYVVDIDQQVGSVHVTGRIVAAAPFHGGTSGRARDEKAISQSKSLAERIERAIGAAVLNFRDDLNLDV